MVVFLHKRTPSRISLMIDKPGGLTAEDALRQATANLEPLRDEALQRIKAHIASLQTINPPPSGDPSGTLDNVYAVAAAIIDCASPFELDDVCVVAAGLCDLVVDVSPERPFDWRVPAVYAGTLALLMTLPADACDQRRQVREGIDAILACKLSPRD